MTINNSGDRSAEAVNETVASFGSRVMAFAIDAVLLGFFMALLLVLTGKPLITPSGAAGGFSQYLRVLGGWFVALLFCFAAVGMSYFCLMHAWCGQTIGKRIMGIRLISRADGDRVLNIERCFLRWVGYFVSALPLFGGFFWALLDVEGRTWHDRLAGTKVIYG